MSVAEVIEPVKPAYAARTYVFDPTLLAAPVRVVPSVIAPAALAVVKTPAVLKGEALATRDGSLTT